ncbi:MAG: hypothetical protein LBD21_05385 [Tannerellaceae bacterium]|jgi:hypothetical protein|nr:hypothetical protein [Tannerellaceae bacterium]
MMPRGIVDKLLMLGVLRHQQLLAKGSRGRSLFWFIQKGKLAYANGRVFPSFLLPVLAKFFGAPKTLRGKSLEFFGAPKNLRGKLMEFFGAPKNCFYDPYYKLIQNF